MSDYPDLPDEAQEASLATFSQREGYIGEFDVAIFGTSLASSILAAALSKAGKSVLHLDSNEYYGSNDASLALHELLEWAKSLNSLEAKQKPFSDIDVGIGSAPGMDQLPEELQRVSRQYALSLSPSLIPASGSFVDALVRSGVSRYSGFRLLSALSCGTEQGDYKQVPSSKEDVFKSNDLSLPAKRRLMKFLLFAAGDFEESEIYLKHKDRPHDTILQEVFALDEQAMLAVDAVALARAATEPLYSLLPRLRSYLRATGRYGNSPFLVGQYGGLGELAQGYCRAAAVHGAVYVLGKAASLIQEATKPEGARFLVTASDISAAASHIVQDANSNDDALTDRQKAHDAGIHRAVIVLDQPIPLAAAPQYSKEEGAESQGGHAESVLVVFPPSAADQDVRDHGPIRMLLVGEETGSCPADQTVVYLSTRQTGERTAIHTLRPYLENLLDKFSKRPNIIFECFYTETYGWSTDQRRAAGLHFACRGPSDLAESPDAALAEAHRLFKSIMGEEAGAELFSQSEASQEDDE